MTCTLSRVQQQKLLHQLSSALFDHESMLHVPYLQHSSYEEIRIFTFVRIGVRAVMVVVVVETKAEVSKTLNMNSARKKKQ